MVDYRKEIDAVDRQINVAEETGNGQITRLRKKKNLLVARAMKGALDG